MDITKRAAPAQPIIDFPAPYIVQFYIMSEQSKEARIMSDFAQLPLEALLGGGFDCECSIHHQTDLRMFKCGAGAINFLPSVIEELGAKKPLLVCDENTYQAAGKRALEILQKAKVDCDLYQFPMAHVEPDEVAVGALTMALLPEHDLLIAVGSGVINDVCKVVGFAANRMQMSLATAPSMDGYASNSSSMHVDGVKVTLYNKCPLAIIADTDILKEAPMRMLWSGLGDMLAKYISICDWRIAHLVTNEYYCPHVAALIRRSLQKCVEHADKLDQRDPDVIAAVTEGLVLSGVAMSFAQVSRPASGLEHYFSHMWEMMAMERHEKADFHGIQVGVGTMITLRLYDWIKKITPDRATAEAYMSKFNQTEWDEMVIRIFGSNAPQIFAMEKKTNKNDPAAHARRLDKILSSWDDILGIIADELPESGQIAALMSQLGMPMYPRDLGISDRDTMDAYTGAREIRDKYQCNNLLWDLGLADAAREEVGRIVEA